MTQLSVQKLPGVKKGFVLVKGVRTRYLSFGHGPTVLLVHGWMGSSIDFPTLFPYLAKSFRVVSFDLPGFGESGRLPSYRMDDYADFIQDFAEALQLRNFYLVGNCFGATIVLDFVIRHPGLAKKLVLFTPVYAKDVLRGKFVTVAKLMRFRYFRAALARFFKSERLMRWAVSKVIKHARGQYKEDAITKKRQVDLPAAAQSAADLLKIDLRPGMRRIRIPVLVVYFENDKILVPTAVTEIKEYLPQTVFVEARGKGHFADPDLMLGEYEKIVEFLK
jgi:pimeloyl-ACP methyl ester carboxylesterase